MLAHPDDVDFGSAGTVATWTAAGTEVTYCIVTDGDAGGFDDTPRDQMGPLRQAEQRAAAAAVGVSDVRFLGYPDGRLELTLDLRRDISRVIRQVRPQRVLTSSPERFWERIGASHPDHMTVGESTLRAVYPDARNPFAFPELLADEGLEAWTVSEVWLGASPRADHAVDVTDVVDRKFAALRSHVSQVEPQPGARKEFVERLDAPDGGAVRPAGGPPGRGLPRRPHHVTCRHDRTSRWQELVEGARAPSPRARCRRRLRTGTKPSRSPLGVTGVPARTPGVAAGACAANRAVRRTLDRWARSAERSPAGTMFGSQGLRTGTEVLRRLVARPAGGRSSRRRGWTSSSRPVTGKPLRTDGGPPDRTAGSCWADVDRAPLTEEARAFVAAQNA